MLRFKILYKKKFIFYLNKNVKMCVIKYNYYKKLKKKYKIFSKTNLNIYIVNINKL